MNTLYVYVKTEIVDTRNFLQTVIDNAIVQITSVLGGYVVKRNGELLIMNTEDVNTATKVWRWNQNGLGYSSTGYSGEFQIAITSVGHIVADFMDTGKLSANAISMLCFFLKLPCNYHKALKKPSLLQNSLW